MIEFYPKLRPLLFKLPPETAHDIGIFCLQKAPFLVPRTRIEQPVNLMGLNFPNRVGLAAGLDKNGVAIPAFERMGFGFIEVGTVTPKAQEGNDKPRLFRLTEHEAIINRMGFNNLGIQSLVESIASIKNDINALIGINLGKNKQTSNENALDDYKIGLSRAYRFADYITINISSPNTLGLRDLQHGDMLKKLLDGVKQTQANCHAKYRKYVPVLVKISPDNDKNSIKEICHSIINSGIDGIIATNTTLKRPDVSTHKYCEEDGGLSGKPLMHQSNIIMQQIRTHLPKIPLIASGGVMSASDYRAKRRAGADLVQIYSGLIYHGPKLIQECLEAETR